MNQQKLNELAMRSGGIWRGGHVEQPNGDSVWTEQKWVDPCDMDLNKFAELIVAECLEQIDKVDDMLSDDKEKIVVAWVGLAIAKHFGVE